MQNKSFVSILGWLLCCLPLIAQEAVQPDSLLSAAANAYNEGRYAESADLYEEVSETYGISAELYYNIGNAYFKANAIPAAILNYERGLRLNPHDKDLKFNLEMAQAYVVDQTETLGEFLLVRWYKAVRRLLHANAWAWVSVVLFWVFVACLAGFFFSKRRVLRKTSFSVGIVTVILSVISLVFARQTYFSEVQPLDAIVFTPSVTVKSSPDQSGTDLFLLHEGTKVHIKSTLGTWAEIVIEDGNVGWMPAECFEII